MSTTALKTARQKVMSGFSGVTRPSPLRAYSPFTPGPPPPGSYDPALDQQLAASQRGLGDLQDDTAIQTQRLGEDYQNRLNGIQQGLGDTRTDLGTAATREGENYGAQTAALGRSYASLGVTQHEATNRLGVLEGGTALQSAAKRAANQGIQQQGLDTTHARSVEDNAQALLRANRNAYEQTGALNIDYANPLAADGTPGSLATGGRAYQDLGRTLSRAEREGAQYGVDTAQTKSAEAAQQGYNPLAGKPSNEFVDPVTGASHKIVFANGYRYSVDPSGHVLSKTRRTK